MKAQDLRNSILQLAIQGKLVKQNPNDEPAYVLYEKIQAEKQKLIKEGKLKKDKPLPPITEDEIPFSIPPTWKWVRLGSCSNLYTGNSISEDIKIRKYMQNIDGYDYIGTKDINFNHIINYDNGVRIPYFESNFKIAYKNSILLCIEGGSAGRKIAITYKDICFGNKLCSISSITISNIYIFYVLQSAYFKESFYNKTTGIIGGVSLNKLKKILIPLPPLEEQKRIVSKIEELEPLIKQYDKAEEELSNLNEKFPEQLKKSILQLAIQGKLVEQNPNDEPADVLYEKIQAEKQKLIKEGKIKKDKPLPPITEDEIPFSIPPTWKWVRFRDIVNYNIGKTPSRNDYRYWGGDYPWVSIADLIDGDKIITTKERVSDKSYYEIFNGKTVPVGTLLMSFKLTIGKISITTFECFHNEAIISIFPYIDKKKITTNFLFKLLPYLTIFSTNIKTAIKGLTLNSESLNNLLIPLPPLEEQKRIVEKVSALLEYCDKLK